MDYYSLLRKLAKSNKYQSLYNYAKELNIKIFENNIDLTDIQLQFLSLLNYYSIIKTDIALGDVDEIVLKDDIYTDAYTYYKDNNYKKEMKELKKPQQHNVYNKRVSKETVDLDSWVFRKKS